MTKDEYQAHRNGPNMFFGAVLGLVLTGTEGLNAWQFGGALTLLASVVTSTLFVSSSRHRVACAVYTLLMALALPRAIDTMRQGHAPLPDTCNRRRSCGSRWPSWWSSGAATKTPPPRRQLPVSAASTRTHAERALSVRPHAPGSGQAPPHQSVGA
ncbi:hypothetical protein [Xanthomonas sacchari]|uniref:hypothetical protein n=1 Tax=Xanthomonas sacchari TaxID=56458 RepID=UPI0020C428DC|nr:hypothetical protein [Xanthomonas sacchari]